MTKHLGISVMTKHCAESCMGSYLDVVLAWASFTILVALGGGEVSTMATPPQPGATWIVKLGQADVV